ncbi:MAG: aminotransferase class I/II-fold pyridoxal phosphate-dependent enzyme [Nocardioides sp.]|jgi:cystathionine beta-lyase|uniref:MalY/PatB family protein n=1 Tax=Nocardioides sp. TaxID=35761 RepID=UPI002606C7BE|nr:aminotransferase class I/II-fold pyridoxal phosphate-dependent enzyme [Nocardioides sp.]MCW2834413.1 aminotransferase class I/II-fold pyridoxal phosphate-dependent enzyme [Nocardioides sp.]
MIRDLTDEEARAALVLKWGMTDPDVLPAWVAEMDYAVADVVTEAVVDAVRAGRTGYPAFEFGGELGQAYADWAGRHLDQSVDPDHVVPVVDVTAGMRLALDVLCEDAPVVMPIPAYSPQLEIAQVTGRRRVNLVVDVDDERSGIDLDSLDRHFAAGARTLILTQPHNPWGRVFTRPELEGIRDVVALHGARVVSDEIWAPLVLPGAEHTSYLAVDGTAQHAVALVAASKAFNIAGLKCAQIVTGDDETRDRLFAVPMARNDSWSTIGVVAAIAAYDQGDPWLKALLQRLDEQRTLLAELLAAELPEARMRRVEGTYLAWIDLRAYGHRNPARVCLERGLVRLSAGHEFHPGAAGHVRLNFATSPERLREIVHRMATALAA